MKKPNNVIRIPCTLDISFFKYWLLFLKPFHKLTDKEILVVAEFMKLRHDLSKVILDDELLDTVVTSDENKTNICKKCEIKTPHFQVIISNLKKKNVLVDNKLNKRFIPNIKEDAESFQLMLYFDIEKKENHG